MPSSTLTDCLASGPVAPPGPEGLLPGRTSNTVHDSRESKHREFGDRVVARTSFGRAAVRLREPCSNHADLNPSPGAVLSKRRTNGRNSEPDCAYRAAPVLRGTAGLGCAGPVRPSPIPASLRPYTVQHSCLDRLRNHSKARCRPAPLRRPLAAVGACAVRGRGAGACAARVGAREPRRTALHVD